MKKLFSKLRLLLRFGKSQHSLLVIINANYLNDATAVILRKKRLANFVIILTFMSYFCIIFRNGKVSD